MPRSLLNAEAEYFGPGFNISLEPGFSPSRLCWMLAYGGIYAVANLRCCHMLYSEKHTVQKWPETCTARLIAALIPLVTSWTLCHVRM